MKNIFVNSLGIILAIFVVGAVFAFLFYLMFGPGTKTSYFTYKDRIIKCERVFGWGIGDSSLQQSFCVDK